jgi:hypothetical protein
MERAIGIFVTICAVGLICSPARADVIFSIAPATISANPGDVGDQFDVVLKNTGPGSISVAGFNFEVSVTNPDITLTGADFSTVASPYIFAGNSFDQNIPLTLNYTSGQKLDASDTSNDGSGVTLASGGSLALGDVLFSIANPAAAGPFTVSFSGGLGPTGANNLSDRFGNPINVDGSFSGTISISGTNTVPEPAIALPLAAALLIAAFFAHKRRRHTA